MADYSSGSAGSAKTPGDVTQACAARNVTRTAVLPEPVKALAATHRDFVRRRKEGHDWRAPVEIKRGAVAAP